MARITMVEAVAMALAWELEHDESVVVLGEDVGINGGVFRATAGLQERFGADRVQDTPLAESMIAGLSVGMAAQGMKPVGEIQFMGFIYPALDQMISHAGRLRHRTRGRLQCPMVLRAPYGGGIHAPEHHSESTEALFAHIPGLRNHCTPGNEGDVITLTQDVTDIERQRLAVVFDVLFYQSVDSFRFQENHGIGVTNGCEQQTVGPGR